MSRATAARPPERTFGLYAAFGVVVGLVVGAPVGVPVELSAVAERLANVP